MPRRDRGGLAVPPANVAEAAPAKDEQPKPEQPAAASKPAPRKATTAAAPRKRAAAAPKSAPAASDEQQEPRLYDALIAVGGRGRQLLAARGLQVEASQGMRPMNVALPVDLANAINAATDRESNPKRDLVIALLYAYCEDMGLKVGS